MDTLVTARVKRELAQSLCPWRHHNSAVRHVHKKLWQRTKKNATITYQRTLFVGPTNTRVPHGVSHARIHMYRNRFVAVASIASKWKFPIPRGARTHPHSRCRCISDDGGDLSLNFVPRILPYQILIHCRRGGPLAIAFARFSIHRVRPWDMRCCDRSPIARCTQSQRDLLNRNLEWNIPRKNSLREQMSLKETKRNYIYTR